MSLFPRATDPFDLGLPVGPYSNVYYVDPANGDDDYPGTSPKKPMASITAAYAACTANQHDVVAYIAGSSSISLTATLTWAKNYTHLVGLCAPTMTAQRARIFADADNDDITPLVNITATGCIFKDLYIYNGVDDAGCLIDVQVTGGRNYFENVHFAGGGHATNAIDGGASLKLDAAEENTFVRCTVGVDTVDAATGMVGILFDSEAHRNVFEDCIVRMRAGNAGAAFVEVADLTGIDRDTLFRRCTFLNNSATSLTSGFVIPAGMGAPRKLLLQDCMILGATKLDANDRGVLYGNMNDVTGADTSGVAVELVT